MKIYSLYMLISITLLYGCSSNETQKSIHFLPLQTAQFNFSADTSFAAPKDDIWQERKRMHDSCMGESFAANAVFLRTKDTFRLGCIVNTKTMKIVANLDMLNIQSKFFGSAFTFMTKPCYEKMELHISPDAFLNQRINLSIPGVNNELNTELANAFNNSNLNEIEVGSWLNMELTDAFGKILDTTTNVKLLDYKKMLLDTTNMVLVKSSSFTDIDFYITAEKPFSPALQKVLAAKPSGMLGDSNKNAQIFPITNNRIQVRFSGIFQVIGQFMQCKLE